MLSKLQFNEVMLLSQEAVGLGRKFNIGTKLLTPYNLEEESEKFFKSDNYNPNFIYVNKKFDIDIPLLEIRHKLNKSKLPTDIQLYFHEYLNDLKVHEQAINTIGTESFSYYAGKLFDWDLEDLGKIKSKLFNIKVVDETNAKIFNSDQMRSIFSNYLNNILKIDDVMVQIDTFNDHIIRVNNGMLVLGSKVRRNEPNINRLKIHEIESHILQHYNLRQANNPFLRLIKQYEFMLYSEGLAVYNEVITNSITKSSLDTYIMRLEAVKMLNKSFREIFNSISRTLSPRKAFILTLRVKRGLGDTSKPGGFPKDAAYIIGYNKILEYILEGGKLTELYHSRVPSINRLSKKFKLSKFDNFRIPSFAKKLY